MERLAIFVYANQNPVSKKEAGKIRRTIKKEYPELRIRTFRNKHYSRDVLDMEGRHDYVLHYNTYDQNGRVFAELVWEISTIGTNNVIIELNHRNK